MEKVSF